MKDYIYIALSKLRFEKFAQLLPELDQFNYSVIKGEALSVQAYGVEGKRFGSDIDILVSRKNIASIEDVLMKYEFTMKSHNRGNKIAMLSVSHQTVPWIKNDKTLGSITIDINHDIFWGEYEGTRVDMDKFLSDSIEIEIYGVKVKALPPIKSLIQLILHHYKDMNSLFLLSTRKSIRYDMFKDVYNLLINNIDSISLDNLYDLSFEYDIVPYVYYTLYYTGQIYNNSTLKKYVGAFETVDGKELINCYGLGSNEKREWRVDFKTRLETENLYDLIKDDLSNKDIEKIALNKKIFLED